jgi:septum formation protein
MVLGRRLILASGSPRRQEMLSSLGLEFDVLPAQVDESLAEGEMARNAVQRLAIAKAESLPEPEQNQFILAADTLVALGSRILGKPTSQGDALRMLRVLADREHRVITAYCLRGHDFQETGVAITHVRFRALNQKELLAYAQSGEPLDKAGAYAVQGLGAALVEDISGSYSNVVGLPLSPVLEMLQRRGVIEPLVV